MIPFTQNVQNRQIFGDRKQIHSWLHLEETWGEGNGEQLLVVMRLFWGKWWNVLKLMGMAAQLCEYTKVAIDLYTLNGWIVWNLNYMPTKLLRARVVWGLPRWHSGKESDCQCRRCRRHRFDPWVGKIIWRRKWQPTPVFLPEKLYGQRSLVGYTLWGHKSQTGLSDWAQHKAVKMKQNTGSGR